MQEEAIYYEQMGEGFARLWFWLIVTYYIIQWCRLRQSKKLGDEERCRKIKRQMWWGFPISLVALFIIGGVCALLI